MSEPRPVPLACGHSPLFTSAPDPGDLIWCFRCAGFRAVARAARNFRARHGTESGYQRHKRDPDWPDESCDECKAAMAERHRARMHRRPTTRAGRAARRVGGQSR